MHIKGRRIKKLALVWLLFIFFLSSYGSGVYALVTSLPEPPTRPNTQGAVSGVGGTYSGNILVVEDTTVPVQQARDKVLGEIICSNEKRTVEVEEESDWGLSVTGPLTEAEMQGVLEAIKDLRPPKKIKMTYELQGNEDEKRKWTHTGTWIEVTYYNIYIVRQAVPAENEFIGILVVEKPVEPLKVSMESEACAQAQPAVQVPEEDLVQGLIGSLTDFFHWLFVELPNDLGLYVFGTVKVYSAGGIAGVMHLRSGESKTIMLPPGSYNVQAVVQVFGIPFELSIGNPSADVPILLTVALLTVEYGAYILGFVLIIIIIIVVYKAGKRIKGGPTSTPPPTPSPSTSTSSPPPSVEQTSQDKTGDSIVPPTTPASPSKTQPKTPPISSQTARAEISEQKFGPHVRGLDHTSEIDDDSLGPPTFLAYGTSKYGVNVSEGDVDADTHEELLSGAGPSAR